MQLQDVIQILYQKQIPMHLIKLIEDIYSGNLAMIKVHGERIHPIPVNQGIRQGDLLSPHFSTS
jgi:hypothetical protein